MNKYSDKVLFEVELEDKEGNKNCYSGGPRTFSILEKITEINDKRDAKNKAKESMLNTIEANYEIFALVFNIPLAEAKKYSNELIVAVIQDWREFTEKNGQAQGKPSK